MDSYKDSLPPDLFDETTLVSLASTVAILAVAYALSKVSLPRDSSSTNRFLFIWHAFDALIHFCLEGSFLYHCFYSWIPLSSVSNPLALAPTAHNYLGQPGRVYGPQAAPQDGSSPTADLWMVYAKADRRWAGADLSVISLELLTVFVAGPLACLVCYGLARQKKCMTNIVMLVIATMELYGGFITFCPEWLTANHNLDTSNWMYLWLYLVFFNMLWVFIPLYVIYVAAGEIGDAFSVKEKVEGEKKGN